MKRILVWSILTFGIVLSSFSHACSEHEAWIGKPDGSKQCEAGGTRAVIDDQAELEKQGIEILASKQDTPKGVVTASMCGGPTGKMNLFKVSRDQLKLTQALGYTEVALPHEKRGKNKTAKQSPKKKESSTESGT